MKKISVIVCVLLSICASQCKKGADPDPQSNAFRFLGLQINGETRTLSNNAVDHQPVIDISFSDKIKTSSVNAAVTFTSNTSEEVPFTASVSSDNQHLVVTPSASLKGFAQYTLKVATSLLSETDEPLEQEVSVRMATAMDSTDKFDQITDDELLTLIEQQTFRYFWDFGHPVSGLARERNTSGDVVTSGGSGFGIMAIIAGIHRNFVTRQQGLERMQKIVGFLKNTAETFHGAYPHWLNGNTGAVIPFSDKDNGADLVETSYLMQGLLSARQFFDGAGDEVALRNDINTIWNGVEWDWFRKENQDVLYWHWSPNFDWQMNFPIRGWNECLITYVMAASSTTHTIPKSVYDIGWAQNGAIANGATYYGVTLPLGPPFGGPLFFSHYSFLGLDPTGLQDAYANYWQQNQAHAMINYNYCVANPEGFAGYSSAVWGLTASDDDKGYSAHAPDNDLGVISPTAAISSLPYTPEHSMAAIRFFYYKLGDKIWKEYGFVDAFNLNVPWFADSFLAIDQGPEVVMIENYRSGLLWDLFMSCPEVKAGLTKLGFQSPHL